jgi:hypothetical protein
VSHKDLALKFDQSIAAIAKTLEPKGFERRGKVIRAMSDGNAQIIEFQKSDKSSDRRIIFTVNIGVVCGDLLDTERTDVNRAEGIDAHLRNRLGMLLAPPSDKWWELSESTDLDALARELSALILSKAVPYLGRFKSADDLIALWESGVSPGLTAIQRSRFLSELKGKKLGNAR